MLREKINALPELHQRILTGTLGAIAVVSALYWSEWGYFAVFFFICMFTLLEFYKLLGLEDGNLPLRSFGTINGLFIYVLSFFVAKYGLDGKYFILAFIGLSGAYFIKLYVKTDIKPFANIAFTFLGIMYVAVPFSLLHFAVYFSGPYTFEVILGALLILWASDTGAYFSGRQFGKRKLFQRISPKKTWEGSVGGAVFALSLALWIGQFYTHLELWQWVCFAAIIIVAGTYGDLVESLFKRSIRIKDSGSSLPGHGGFLDRFDGLLIASPFIVAFLKLI